ncbi:TPA: MerR family transcriptional regulator [Pseudomonas aeruginosa]|nr:MerR family transcriptional regulator [Pseudomonas aeruginosa]
MLISEFSRSVDLTVDAVRFYVRLGLLKPGSSSKGGSRPYQVFAEEDAERVRLIRMLQMLGYSLKDIAGLLDEHASGKLTRRRTTEVLNDQLGRLRAQRDHLDQMMAYVSAKLKWVDGKGKAPKFDDYTATRRPRSDKHAGKRQRQSSSSVGATRR